MIDQHFIIIPVKAGHESYEYFKKFLQRLINLDISKEVYQGIMDGGIPLKIENIKRERRDGDVYVIFVIDGTFKEFEAFRGVGAEIIIDSASSADGSIQLDFIYGDGSYGSAIGIGVKRAKTYVPALIKLGKKIGYIAIADLTDDFFFNHYIAKICELTNEKYDTPDVGVCTRFDPRSIFPKNIGDNSSWFRSWGRRVITYLFNKFILKQIGNIPTVGDATLSFKAYKYELFKKEIMDDYSVCFDVNKLVAALKGRSPFETQIILSAWITNRPNINMQFWKFNYVPTKSTLRLKNIFAALNLMCGIVFSIFWIGNWKELIYYNKERVYYGRRKTIR